jgi:signal peptidase I
MANENIIPSSEQRPGGNPPAGSPVTTGPVANGQQAPGSTPAASQPPGPSLFHDVKAGLMELAVGIILGLVVMAGLWWYGTNIRAAAAAGVLTAIVSGAFARSLLRHHVAKARPAPSEQGAQQPHHAPDSTREIIETVVFVVVLVLLLKSFVAEAFVIPTGSMAETLWGYQKVVTCPQCDFQFPVNCSAEVDPATPAQREPTVGCICPNCRLDIRLIKPEDKPNGINEVPDPGWSSGDRVLVAKFLYEMFNQLPGRLDVVVFKFPGDSPNEGPFPESGPFKKNVPMNYIKRLIGLPGETVAIHRGKLFILSADKGLQHDDLKEITNEEERKQKARLLWRKDHMYANEEPAKTRFKEGQFQIIRKTPDNILAMMRIVYDNDHQARDLKGKLDPRWAPGGTWTPDGATGFYVAAANDSQEHRLHYRHILRNQVGLGKPQLITDFMGYNTWETPDRRTHPRPPGENWVSDLILETEAVVESPQGEVSLELCKGVDRFRATWDMGTGFCTVYRLGKDGKPESLKSARSVLKPKSTHRLRLANVDDKLTVWVDNNLVFGEEGVTYVPAKDLGPVEKNDLDEPASILVKGAKVQVRHLKLFRDTYYTMGRAQPSNADHGGNVDFSNPKTWQPLMDLKDEVATLYVQPEHFLCLGDNSPESSDGRSWGLVPKRLLLGRAVVVYYPFYFPFWPLNSQVNRVGVIN